MKLKTAAAPGGGKRRVASTEQQCETLETTKCPEPSVMYTEAQKVADSTHSSISN